MLKLRSNSIVRKIGNIVNSGPVQSAAVSGTAASIGIIAGHRNDCKRTPVVALAAGAVANMIGLHGIGDGSMAAGASLLGYCRGAGNQKTPALAPVPVPVAPPKPKKKKSFFGF